MTTPKQLTDYTTKQLKEMTLGEIATIIKKNWKETAKNGVYFGAVPYLDAMYSLGSTKDNYGADSGKSIVTYFLCNASTWKGPVAKEIKAHLNKCIK